MATQRLPPPPLHLHLHLRPRPPRHPLRSAHLPYRQLSLSPGRPPDTQVLLKPLPRPSAVVCPTAAVGFRWWGASSQPSSWPRSASRAYWKSLGFSWGRSRYGTTCCSRRSAAAVCSIRCWCSGGAGRGSRLPKVNLPSMYAAKVTRHVCVKCRTSKRCFLTRRLVKLLSVIAPILHNKQSQ